MIHDHVGVPGNEAVDELAASGCDLSISSSTVLNDSEFQSLQRTKMNLAWRNPSAQHWYAAKTPGLPIQCRSSRSHQTALTRFRSGHLRSMTFMKRVKSFFTCPCSLPTSPVPLLDCWAFPCNICMKRKTWCVTLLRGKVKWTWSRLSCSKGIGNSISITEMRQVLVLAMVRSCKRARQSTADT
ncbi:uncharacterized protein TNCV_4756901 [Trichonephila clavipes]|nr:uncharacterized protein TNCV_4756901 [Trichonephila clavipes]